MAIRPEHENHHRSMRAAFSKVTSVPKQFVKDFGKTYAEEVGKGFENIVLLPMLGAVCGCIGGIVIGFPGALVLKEVEKPEIAVEDIAYGIENETGVEAIQTNSETYALIHHGDGVYSLYEYDQRNDRLEYIPSVGDALEIVDRLTDQLQTISAEYVAGEFTSDDIPNFVSFSDMTEPYIINDTVLRKTSGIIIPEEARQFETSLSDATNDWEAALQAMRSTAYGYSASEQADFDMPERASEAAERAFFAFMFLGLVAGGLSPVGLAASQTVSKRRKEKAVKKKANPSL